MALMSSDLPSLFVNADGKSQKAQKLFTRLTFATILLTVLASMFGVILYAHPETKKYIAYLLPISLALPILINLYINNQKLQVVWYEGRAVAESIKTRAWKFMMRSDPYHENLTDSQAIQLFANVTSEIINNSGISTNLLAGDNGNLVTDEMKRIRNLTLGERKKIYINDRIEDQRNWYSQKSSYNLSASTLWNVIIILLQSFTLLLSIIVLNNPDASMNLIGIFTTITASILAWTQLKRYQDLANSYSIAANELAVIKTKIDDIDDNSKFSVFVSDAENAVSREHTLWAARREATN